MNINYFKSTDEVKHFSFLENDNILIMKMLFTDACKCVCNWWDFFQESVKEQIGKGLSWEWEKFADFYKSQ